MAKIIPGRYTAKAEGPFVVFLIGMRINHFWQIWKWLPVALAMGPMLKTLFQHPQKGFLSGEFMVYWKGPAIIQYWRSFEDLENFARSPQEPHLSAWIRFNKSVGVDGSVGIWHETYKIEPGSYECIYNNMPVFGLAKAFEPLSASSATETARRRLGGQNQPAVPSPENRA